MALTTAEFAGLLSREPVPAPEQVIAVKPVRKSLRFNKEEWDRHFADFGGIEIRVDGDVEVLPAAEGKRSADIPAPARELLGLEKGGTLCVTKRNGRFLLKRLDFAVVDGVVPGCYVFDAFTDRAVSRTCELCPDPAAITERVLDQLLSDMGAFRHDPVAPFTTLPGMLGFLARKAFAGGLTADDRGWAKEQCEALSRTQAADGSWQDAVPATAFTVIRLLELGRAPEDDAVRRAVEWLLARAEPVGFPGTFMSSDGFLERFNDWKKPGAKGRKGRTTPQKDRNQFWENRDLFGVPDGYCEARFTWTNGVVLAALLQCGLDKHPRVVRAINTLMKRSGDGGWCGCGYFDTGRWNFVEPDDSPVDLDRFPVPATNRRHSCNWFATAEDAMALAHPWNGVRGTDTGDGRSLVSGAVGNSGDCSRVMHRGLSYHPNYRGSNLEAIAALHCIAHQTAQGLWRGHFLSFVFGMLARCRHPLSAFAALRSVPLLIRKQRPDGFWSEDEPGYNIGMHTELPTPSKEESSLLILQALHAHGFLDRLR